MDTVSMMDEDPTLPIDFDQSTNMLNFLERDKTEDAASHRESLLSPEGSLSEADNKHAVQKMEPNTPERGTLREHEEIIGKFKKENFGLKLRIYFLEERLQMAYEEDTEDVLKTNIELKVNIEQLKKELGEKQNLLIKASKAIETITIESEKHIQKIKDEFTDQYDQMRDELQKEIDLKAKNAEETEKKIEKLNEELLKAEQSKLQLQEKLNGVGVDPNVIEELELKEKEFEDKFQHEIQEKDAKIRELEKMKSSFGTPGEIEELRTIVTERDVKIENLKKELQSIASQSPERSNQHYEVLYNKLEAQNADNESKLKDLNKELKKKTNLVEELKDYINKTERVNKELRNSVHDKETEKHRSSMSLQEHIRRLDLALSNKEKELNRCHSQIGKLEEFISKLQNELATQQEVKDNESKGDQEKLEAIASLRADLQEKELLSKKYKQVLDDKDKELLYFNSAKVKAEQDLQSCIAQKNAEIQAINEHLKNIDQMNRDKLLALEDQCQKLQEESQVQLNNKDKLIQRLANALRSKDILIEELVIPQDISESGSEQTPQDSGSQIHVLKKLRAKIKDMDHALETSLDEKFKLLTEKDKEILELKRLLREKDREIESLKTKVASNERDIQHRQNLSLEKDQVLQDLQKGLEFQENSFKVSSETAAKELESYQLNAMKLSKLLDSKESQLRELQKYLIQNSGVVGENGLREINEQMDAQGVIMQELTSQRDAAVSRNEINKQKFIAALNSKDAQIRDAFSRMGRLMEEKNDAIKQLKSLVEQKNHELQVVEKKLSEIRTEKDSFAAANKQTANEKDLSIENLTKSGLEKDRIISELQERPNIRPNDMSQSLHLEIDSLKEKLQDVKEQLRLKTDEANEFKVENKHLRQTLESGKKSENIEITMKFDTLKTELEDKDRRLQDARGELWELQKEISRAATLTESLQQKIFNLQAENGDQASQIEKLKKECQEKEEALSELRKDVSGSKELNEALQKLNQQKNSLENAVNELHAEMEVVQISKRSLEVKLAEADDVIQKLRDEISRKAELYDSKAQECEDLRRENHDLKSELERGSKIPQRYEKPIGGGTDEVDSKELRGLLKMQIQEQQRLFKVTEEERAQYLKLISELQNQSASKGNAELEDELKSVSDLRLQYEESIRHNDALRHQLETQIQSALKPLAQPPSSESEIHNLKRKLEESESWNRSLQTRLEQLLPRAAGVGASVDFVDGTGATVSEIDGSFQKLQQEKQQALHEIEELISTREQLEGKLEEAHLERNNTKKALDDLKRHYDRFAQLRSKEIETLTSNCEQAKTVIRNMEEKVTSLHSQLQSLKGGKSAEQENLRKQVDGLSAVNDVLRKTLNEKSEELKEANENVLKQNDVCKKLESVRQSLADDQKLLMEQIQEKNGQIAKLRKDVERFKSEIEERKEDYGKLVKECDVLQRDRQVLRDLNERLRNKLDEVSQTYDSLKGSNETEIRALKDDLKTAKFALEEQMRENEEATAVTIRLRDEIRSLQESSREVQRLADELKRSQNVNRALQRQLNEDAQDRERKVSEPEMNLMKQKIQELINFNQKLEEKLRVYERHAKTLREESNREKEAFNAEKEAQTKEIQDLTKDVLELDRANAELEQRVKDLIHMSENSKVMVDRLEMDNKTKQEIIEKFENEFAKQRTLFDVSTSVTPNKGVSMYSQTTPTKLTREYQSQTTPDSALKEALLKRDAYIDALKKQIEFYKIEKGKTEQEKRGKLEEDSSNNNNLIALHIAEMRELRKELEQSIRNNDALRSHLEHRLSEAEKEAEQMKDPHARVSLLRENDRLRAKIAGHEIEIDEMKTKLLREDQRSSGLFLEKDNQIQQLRIKLEQRNLEFERMQTFAPKETSSTVASPIQSIAHFTQTTPIKAISLSSKEIQVDTIALRAAIEKKQLEEKLTALIDELNSKEVVIKDLEKKNEKFREAFESEIKLKSEINNMKLLLESKESVISGLELKIKDLEVNLTAQMNESFLDAEKKATNDELIALHISEMRKLKSELELSIKNNNELKSQLEHRLNMIEQDAKKLKDPQLRLSLVRDNDLLRTQSIERQNAVLKHQTTIDRLVAERKSDKESIKKLHQQVHNLNKVTANLKEEVTLYDRLQEQLTASAARKQAKSHSPDAAVSRDNTSDSNFDPSLLQILLEEIRNLRVQLQKSAEANIALKDKLEEQLGRSLNSSGFSSPANPTLEPRPNSEDGKGGTVRRALFSTIPLNDGVLNDQAFNQPGNVRPRYLSQETPTKENGSPASKSKFLSQSSLAAIVDDAANEQMFIRGKLEDYVILKNKLANCCQRIMLMQDVHEIIQSQRNITANQMTELRDELDRLSIDLGKCRKLVDLMRPEENGKKEDIPDNSMLLENRQLKSEINNLKKRLSYQDKLIKSSLHRLEESNKVKGDLEHQILEKLKTTHGTMIKASQNLEDKIVKSKTPPKQARPPISLSSTNSN
ncbi:myomegalin-like isoform X3 [Rhopilema esculentum]|uniref:myomegalin-like isoform X3 n=1 Tax=Rhopilema esculentum TaxID=499914 RepID=UPI0031D8C85A